MSDSPGRWRFALAVAVVAALGSSCLKADAKTPAPRLGVPDPPSRLAIPVPVEAPEPTPAPPAATEKPTTSGANKPVVSRPPPTSSGSTTGSAGTQDPPPPGQVLLPGTGAADLEVRTRERLDRAQRDLKKVNRASLGTDAQEQFDSAQRFVRMATDALTVRNYVFALTCADKAATLAALLSK